MYGQAPVLDPAEARALLDISNGLHDRILIALMVYSFARIGAALGMTVEDVDIQTVAYGCGCARRAVSAARCRATTPSSHSRETRGQTAVRHS
jgi:hypothetical protein